MGNKSSLMLQDDEIKQISEQTGFSAQQIEKLYSRFTQLDGASCGSLSKADLMSIPELAINPLCDRLIEMFLSEQCDDQEQQHRHNHLEPDELRINFRQFMRVLAAFRSSQTASHRNSSSRAARAPAGRQHDKSSTANWHQDEYGASQRESTRRVGVVKSRSKSSSSEQEYGHHYNASTLAKPNHPNCHTTPTAGTLEARREGSPSSPIVESLSVGLKDKLYFVFKIYDADNDGRISFNDLKCILKLMVGSYIEEAQLDKIATRAFVEVDQDKDGFVGFSEFCKVFAGKDMDEKLRVEFF